MYSSTYSTVPDKYSSLPINHIVYPQPQKPVAIQPPPVSPVSTTTIIQPPPVPMIPPQQPIYPPPPVRQPPPFYMSHHKTGLGAGGIIGIIMLAIGCTALSFGAFKMFTKKSFLGTVKKTLVVDGECDVTLEDFSVPNPDTPSQEIVFADKVVKLKCDTAFESGTTLTFAYELRKIEGEDEYSLIELTLTDHMFEYIMMGGGGALACIGLLLWLS